MLACVTQARERARLLTAMGMQRRWATKWMCQLRCFWMESMSCQTATQRSQVLLYLTAASACALHIAWAGLWSLGQFTFQRNMC